jgi:four helix bundle protein
MSFTFEKLLVYQKAVDFADRICSHTENFTRGYGFLVDQLNRAALSIAANIGEGNARFTKADRRNFFGIARGSVQECVPLLELASRRRLGIPLTPRRASCSLRVYAFAGLALVAEQRSIDTIFRQIRPKVPHELLERAAACSSSVRIADRSLTIPGRAPSFAAFAATRSMRPISTPARHWLPGQAG